MITFGRMTPSSSSLSRREVLRWITYGTLGAAGTPSLAQGAVGTLGREESPEEVRGRSKRKLGVALLGLGYYAEHQLGPALRETEHCRLAGVITGTPSKGERWAQDYQLPAESIYSYETMDRIADDPEIDIVYVVTPPGLHREFCERAARAGKHVISEKPMANTVEDCDAMIAACAEAGVQLSIGYRLHFDPHHQVFKRMAREERFGAFEAIRSGHAFHLGERAWRVDKELGGGGPLMDLGVYIVQAACMAAGEALPVSVTAEEPPKVRPELFNEVEETIHFTLEFRNGLICHGETSFQESANYLRAEAPEGWLEMESAYAYDGIQTRSSDGTLPRPESFNQQAAQMDAFAMDILHGERSQVPGAMGRRDMQIIEAIYEAARTGSRVTL